MIKLSSYIDIAFCTVVLPLMILIFPMERWFHNFPHYVVSIILWLYVLYFLNRGITVPALFGKGRKRIIGIALIGFSIIVTLVFSSIELYSPKPNIYDFGINRVFPKVSQYRQAVWSLYMIVMTFSFAVGLLTQANLQRDRRRKVESERDRAEISLYKAQIKPHFLFNTLNSLYGLFLTGSDNALPSLERFISMIRYVHQTSHLDMIQLSEEVEYIKEYVELQSLRLNEMTNVRLVVDIANETAVIPPMLLITFVENCFKHGVSPVEESNINISISERSGLLLLSTSNRIFPTKKIGEHMGIENCRHRLELLYPDAHSLTVDSDDRTFRINLMIQLNHD